MTHRLILWCLLVWLGGNALAAEQRFPPPEFETPYEMGAVTTPPPRGLISEYFDVGVLVLTLTVAAWLVHRRRSRRGLAAL